jgi:hypothetical protein
MAEIDVTKYYLVNQVENEDGEKGLELLSGSYLSEDEAESNMVKFQEEGVSPIVQKGIQIQNVEFVSRKKK